MEMKRTLTGDLEAGLSIQSQGSVSPQVLKLSSKRGGRGLEHERILVRVSLVVF